MKAQTSANATSITGVKNESLDLCEPPKELKRVLARWWSRSERRALLPRVPSFVELETGRGPRSSTCRTSDLSYCDKEQRIPGSAVAAVHVTKRCSSGPEIDFELELVLVCLGEKFLGIQILILCLGNDRNHVMSTWSQCGACCLVRLMCFGFRFYLD